LISFNIPNTVGEVRPHVIDWARRCHRSPRQSRSMATSQPGSAQNNDADAFNASLACYQAGIWLRLPRCVYRPKHQRIFRGAVMVLAWSRFNQPVLLLDGINPCHRHRLNQFEMAVWAGSIPPGAALRYCRW
jgi:hypothetical protein